MIHITGKEDKQTIDRSLRSYLSILDNRIQKSSINIDELKIDLRQAVADVDKLRSIVEGQRLLLLQVVDSEKSHFSSFNDHRYDDSLEYIRKVLEGVDNDLKEYAGDIENIVACIGSCQSCQSTQTTCNTCNSSEQNVQPQPCNQTPTPCYDSCGACETSQTGCTFCNSGQTPQCKETYCTESYTIDCTGCVSDYHEVCDHCFGTAYSDCWAEQLACPTYDPGCSGCQGNYHCNTCVSTQTIPCTQNPGCQEDQMQDCGTAWSNQICRSTFNVTCTSTYKISTCPSGHNPGDGCFSGWCGKFYDSPFCGQKCSESHAQGDNGTFCEQSYSIDHQCGRYESGPQAEYCKVSYDNYCAPGDSCGSNHSACTSNYMICSTGYKNKDQDTCTSGVAVCASKHASCSNQNGTVCESTYSDAICVSTWSSGRVCKEGFSNSPSSTKCENDYRLPGLSCDSSFETCDFRNGNKTTCEKYATESGICMLDYTYCGGSNTEGCYGGYHCTGTDDGCNVCHGTAYFCSSCYIQAVCSKCNTTQTCGNEEAVWTCGAYVRGRNETGDWQCPNCYGGCETNWTLSDGCIAGVIPPADLHCNSCDHCEGCNTCQSTCYATCYGCNTSCESCESSCQSGNSCGSCQSAFQSGQSCNQSCNQSCSDTPKPPCEYTSCSSCVGYYSISCAGSSFGPCDQYTCNNCYRTTYSSCSNGY